MNLNNQTTVNVQEKSNLIWSIADLIRDFYKAHEYGKVILPMTVIKRFNDTLAPTKAKVLETYEKVKHLDVIEGFLETASGYQFYNTSVYDFEKLVNDSEHIEENFRDFLNGFSDNVQDILENFEFDREITKLANNGMLFLIIEAVFTQSIFPEVFKKVTQECYMESMEAFSKLFEDKVFYATVMEAISREAYKELRNKNRD